MQLFTVEMQGDARESLALADRERARGYRQPRQHGYQQRRAMLRAADAAYCVKHGDLVTYCGCRHGS